MWWDTLLFATPWTATHQASLSLTISRSLPKFMSIELVMPTNYLFLYHLLLYLPSIFLSISTSSKYSRLVSFRIDWSDLLAVQGTLKSLLQHHNSKESILQHSAFFMVQLSQAYITTKKNIGLTRWTFVDKVMSLPFNMLSRLVIHFLPKSKHLLISWLQSPSAVILEPPKNSLSLFTLLPHLFAMKWWDQMPWS